MTSHKIIRLKPKEGRRARAGAPWIFSNEIKIDAAAKELTPGTIVNVACDDGQPLGTGYFNSKSLIAVRLLAPLLFPGLEPPPLYIATWEPVVCGLMAIVGHVYPAWHGFRGGKGGATLVGVVLGLDSTLMLPMLLTWFLAVMLFGYVGLASMLAAASIPVYVSLTGLEPGLSLTCFGVIATALIVYTHRTNIARMRAGTEPRARRLWLFGKGR